MSGRFLIGAAVAAVTFTGVARGEFASSVHSFTQGTVNFADGVSTYSTSAAALGEPDRTIGVGVWPGPLAPLNPPFLQSEAVAVGLGGSLTLKLATPIAVDSSTKVGVFTTTGLLDTSYPDGAVGATATTYTQSEYAAERTAHLWVGSDPDAMIDLGRILFNLPSQGYANQTDPYTAPDVPQNSDFNKPFTGTLSDFNGKSYAQIVQLLDGSGGGTWIDVPTNLGLASIQYIGFSNPQWLVIENGQPAYYDTRVSSWDDTFTKSADLMIDAVNVVPEPTGLLLLAASGLLLKRRRLA